MAILDKFKLDHTNDFKDHKEYVEDRLKEFEAKPNQPAPQNIISQIFSTYDIHVQLKHPSTLDSRIVQRRIAEISQELGKLCTRYGVSQITATESKNGPGLPPLSINH